MIRSFTEKTLNKLLTEINECKLDKRPLDHTFFKKIGKYISNYEVPPPLDENVEDYLESLLEWPRRNLFTYGTLMPGEAHHKILDPWIGLWQKGYSKGNLYSMGWGMDYGLPAMKWDPQGQDIPGYLFISKQLDWQVLDNFEGAQYQRIWVLVMVDDKVLSVANAYQGLMK